MVVLKLWYEGALWPAGGVGVPVVIQIGVQRCMEVRHHSSETFPAASCVGDSIRWQALMSAACGELLLSRRTMPTAKELGIRKALDDPPAHLTTKRALAPSTALLKTRHQASESNKAFAR
jgi:hypothetical protein